MPEVRIFAVEIREQRAEAPLPLPLQVKGQVLDRAGRPLAGVVVRASSPAQQIYVVSDAGGRFTLELSAGSYSVRLADVESEVGFLTVDPSRRLEILFREVVRALPPTPAATPTPLPSPTPSPTPWPTVPVTVIPVAEAPPPAQGATATSSPLTLPVELRGLEQWSRLFLWGFLGMAGLFLMALIVGRRQR